ncbi:MAG: hypothetical protein RI580_02785 [Halothece sp. Uz-M2-17]|nr:hypothetical protein [Halothece sp. Uz-M2-17]
METPEIRVEGTQGVLDLKENDEKLNELISLIVAAQPYLFLPAEDGMEELRHFIKFQNQQRLMKNWNFTRPLQLWEIEDNSLNLMGRQAEDGESFVGLSIPHNGVEAELPIQIWVEADEEAQTAMLYLPSEDDRNLLES